MTVGPTAKALAAVNVDWEMNENTTVPLPLDSTYISVEILCAVVSIVGNSLVILLFVKYENLRTVTNYYVISLAIADLLVGLIGIPSAIATSVGLPPNFQACLFMNSVLMLLCTCSIFSLVAVTVDRFWAIMWPFTYPTKMTKRNAMFIIAVCWALASAIGLLPSMGWNKGEPPKPQCFFMEVFDLRYLVFIYFATIVAPSAFMAWVYVLIYRVVRKQVRRMSVQMPQNLMLPREGGGEQQSSRRLAAEGKAAKNIAIIVVLFVVSWIPLYTLNTIMCFCKPCRDNMPESLIKFAIVLSHFNSAWNPALYAWGMRDFKEHFRKMLGIFKKPRTLNIIM